MHLQSRASPTLSPHDLHKLLKLVADNGYNLIAAGGSNVEKDGGAFALAVEDEDDPGRPQRLNDLLTHAGYHADLVTVDYCQITPGHNSPGELANCVKDVVAKHAGTGKQIKDLAIGQRANGNLLVQFYFE